MKRIAFFVEGLTEQLFLTKLISEVCTKNHLAITLKKGIGGSCIPISFTTISAKPEDSDCKYSVLIYDCSSQNNIKSYLLEQRESLIRNGYSRLIGIRDVYPMDRGDIHNLQRGLYYQVPQKPIAVDFYLSIMEIEAWFLSEANHYSKVSNQLTVDLIHQSLAFHPVNDNMEERLNPALDLHNSYQLVGESYAKNKGSIERTINALDYAELFFQLPNKIPSLRILVNEINAFFN